MSIPPIPPVGQNIIFVIGATPITNFIPYNCDSDIPTLQALINANIIVAGVTITIVSFDDDFGVVFNVSIATSEIINSVGKLYIYLGLALQSTTEFNFVCTLNTNKLLVISKMLAGLQNNP